MLPPLVADANIAYAVVEFLRSQDVDILYVREEGWQFYADQDILANAHAMRRFVLTHDNALISIRIPKDMMRLDAL